VCASSAISFRSRWRRPIRCGLGAGIGVQPPIAFALARRYSLAREVELAPRAGHPLDAASSRGSGTPRRWSPGGRATTDRRARADACRLDQPK
jgi:hypothetical protein